MLPRRVVVIRRMIGILRIIRIRHLPPLNMRAQPLIEIPHTHRPRHNRHHQQQNCEHRECCEAVPSLRILVGQGAVIHSDEFEDEVGHADEVKDDDDGLARVGFAAGEVGGEEEEDDGDGEGGDGEDEFVKLAVDDDEELDGEAEEEEEVEFEEGDVDLGYVSVGSCLTSRMYGGVEYTWYVRYRRLSRRSAEMCL